MVNKFDYKLQPKNEIPNTKQATSSLNQENVQTLMNLLQSIIKPQSSALEQSEESSQGESLPEFSQLKQNIIHLSQLDQSSQLQKNTTHLSQLDQSSEFATSSQAQNSSSQLHNLPQLGAALPSFAPYSRIKRNAYGEAVASCPKLIRMYIYIYFFLCTLNC